MSQALRQNSPVPAVGEQSSRIKRVKNKIKDWKRGKFVYYNVPFLLKCDGRRGIDDVILWCESHFTIELRNINLCRPRDLKWSKDFHKSLPTIFCVCQ